jgi:hypothetical protein
MYYVIESKVRTSKLPYLELKLPLVSDEIPAAGSR